MALSHAPEFSCACPPWWRQQKRVGLCAYEARTTSTTKKRLGQILQLFDFGCCKKFNCNEVGVGAPPFLAIFWGKPAFEQLHFSLTSHSLPKIPAVLPRSGHFNLFDFASNPEIFFHPLPAAASAPPPVPNLRFRPLDLYFLRENTTVSLRRNRCKSKVL